MAIAFEADQTGKRQSLANLIANVEVEACPYTSMLEKRERPKQVLHQWQVKSYPVTGHRGVLDGLDANSFQSNPRYLMQGLSQKTWYKPGVSDFAEETEVAGLSRGEMAEQIADAMVTVKRQIEKRCLSAEDNALDDGSTHGNETRGIFSYLQNSAQSYLPVPEGFRTPTASRYTGTLANYNEETLLGMGRSAYKQRKGTSKLTGLLGIDFKAKHTTFSVRQDNVTGTTPVRTFFQNADENKLIRVIDKLVLDTGEIDLMPTSFLYTDVNTGADSDYTHRSGVFVDMEKAGLAYVRLPRVVQLPYQGGGKKAIVDAIFLHMIDNPLGHMVAAISADS